MPHTVSLGEKMILLLCALSILAMFMAVGHWMYVGFFWALGKCHL